MIQIEPAVLSDIDCCSGCGIDGFKTGETANGWIVILWLTGFSTEVRSRGAIGFHTFLFGAHWPILIHFWLFCFRMIGAEDIKFSSFPGGFSGSAAILKYVCRSFVFGETLSLDILLICGNIRQRLFKFTTYIQHFFLSKLQRKTTVPIPYRDGKWGMECIHFSVPILLAVLLWLGGFY